MAHSTLLLLTRTYKHIPEMNGANLLFGRHEKFNRGKRLV